MERIDRCITVIGKESSGKSRLVTALSERAAYSANFRGATVACEVYRSAGRTFVDTPGILRRSDTTTTRAAMDQLRQGDVVLLVVQATHIDDDLADLLPLAAGKPGVVAVTFWDKVHANDQAKRAIDALAGATGLPFIPVDARRVTSEKRSQILQALDHPRPISPRRLGVRAGWRIEPPPTVLELAYIGPLAALLLLLAPAIAAVYGANTVAARLDPLIRALLEPVSAQVAAWPSLLAAVLAGRYGLTTMGPLLLVWATPTVVLYALFLGVYKASGLLDRITVALHPAMRPLGLGGRDLARVIMGFGCNVPAVISTRACSDCSRGTCIAAIAYGAACSYQFGATLAVFTVTGHPFLVVPFLLYLGATAAIYTAFTAPPVARSQRNLLLVERRAFLEWPRCGDIWRESRLTLAHFCHHALPIFFLITMLSSMLDWFGAIGGAADLLGPALAAFRLPADAALPVALASIRKDGILVLAEQTSTGGLSAGQILTGVYLTGVLTPCLVTMLTIAREQSARFALKLLARQAIAAVLFSLLLAWGCALVGQ